MKKGGASSRRLSYRPVGAGAAVVGGERCSSFYRLLVGGDGRWEFAPVAQFLRDRQAARGSVAPAGSEGLVAGEHVPDRFGEPAGEVDLGDLGAALFADARFRLLVAVAIDAVGAGVGGGLDERPAEIAGALLGERTAQGAFA